MLSNITNLKIIGMENMIFHYSRIKLGINDSNFGNTNTGFKSQRNLKGNQKYTHTHSVCVCIYIYMFGIRKYFELNGKNLQEINVLRI